MNKEIKKRWVKALRSGKYKQGFKALRINDTYCVLGVLCDLYGQDKGLKWVDISGYGLKERYFSMDNGSGAVTAIIQRWAELNSKDLCIKQLFKLRRSLPYLNDYKKYSFKKLARIIQRHL